MSTRLTLFTATLVQDSALSVSGLDRESSADQPFALVDGVPTMVGRGLKGAAVAMAKRFFDPLPRAVSDDITNGALRRSAWEFEDATAKAVPRLRAGVGIRHRTGARADGVLYDREVIPAGTRWPVCFRVDWSQVSNDAEVREVEGILGYVLAQQWAAGRCWLGGGAARGLGWCHLEDLQAYRFDAKDYERWVEQGRPRQPQIKPISVPVVTPTRSWCFRTLDLEISFGEYRPDPDEPAWGLDMLAIGPHDAEREVQAAGDGNWAMPSWATGQQAAQSTVTDRAILLEGGRPLLPGASVRGPLRHAFSRAERAAGRQVQDPHLVQGKVAAEDAGGQAFGTVRKSSRILIRDGRVEGEWAAAKLHMHAEDELSAGSYGSAKRDAVRVLKGVFPVRIVIEGPSSEGVEPLCSLIDNQVALGTLGHLPVGGHKTRGAGSGHWSAKAWVVDDVRKMRDWSAPNEIDPVSPPASRSGVGYIALPTPVDAWVRTCHGTLDSSVLTLGEAAKHARLTFGDRALVAWWCDPAIDLAVTSPPAVFGREWPESKTLKVDEVAFYAQHAVWRAARTVNGVRYVFIEEVAPNECDARLVTVVHTPARLHGFRRFSSENTGAGRVMLREWYVGDESLGFTVTGEQR